jgi:hypothetical protein
MKLWQACVEDVRNRAMGPLKDSMSNQHRNEQTGSPRDHSSLAYPMVVRCELSRSLDNGIISIWKLGPLSILS